MDRSVAFVACNHSSVLSTLVGVQWGSQGSSIVFSVNSPNCTLANSFCYFCCQTCPEFHFTQARLQPNLAERGGHSVAKQKRLERTAPSRHSAEGMKGRGGTEKTWLHYRLMCTKMKQAKGGRGTGRDPIGTVPWLRSVSTLCVFIHFAS